MCITKSKQFINFLFQMRKDRQLSSNEQIHDFSKKIEHQINCLSEIWFIYIGTPSKEK